MSFLLLFSNVRAVPYIFPFRAKWNRRRFKWSVLDQYRNNWKWLDRIRVLNT